MQGVCICGKTTGRRVRWEPAMPAGGSMAETDCKHALEAIPGDRDRLEAEIVEDLFLNRYDPAKAARLKRRGRLTPVPDVKEGCPTPSGPAIPRR